MVLRDVQRPACASLAANSVAGDFQAADEIGDEQECGIVAITRNYGIKIPHLGKLPRIPVQIVLGDFHGFIKRNPPLVEQLTVDGHHGDAR